MFYFMLSIWLASSQRSEMKRVCNCRVETPENKTCALTVLVCVLILHDEWLTHALSGWRVLKSHDRVTAGEQTSSFLSSGDFPTHTDTRSRKQCEDRGTSAGLRESREGKRKESQLCEPQRLSFLFVLDGIWRAGVLSLSSQWGMEMHALYRTLQEVHHGETRVMHRSYIHTVLYVLLITDRWKNAHFTSIHLIQWLTGIDSIHTWIIELILSVFINHKLGFGFVQLDLGVNIQITLYLFFREMHHYCGSNNL